LLAVSAGNRDKVATIYGYKKYLISVNFMPPAFNLMVAIDMPKLVCTVHVQENLWAFGYYKQNTETAHANYKKSFDKMICHMNTN
jgi:hypothetical protein